MADDDLGLPKSTMLKAIKEQLPAEMRLSGDAADVILRCCNEFVLMVSTTANQICDKEKKSTIVPEHVVAALQELGFETYLDTVNQSLAAFKDTAKEAIAAKKQRKAARPGAGYSPEELLRMQQELLQASAARARALEEPVPPAGAAQMGAVADLQQQQEQQEQQQPPSPPPPTS